MLQVLGITMEQLWEKLAEHIGPERVAMIRGAIDKLAGVWAFIQDVQESGIRRSGGTSRTSSATSGTRCSSMAKDWIMETIVVKATAKLLSMLDPTGIMAVINSFIAFFNAVQSAIEYLRDILEIVNKYVVDDRRGRGRQHRARARRCSSRASPAAIPVAIGFLANQVGLGNIPEKIVEIIGRLRELVDKALDWLIEQALRLGGRR